MAPVNGNAGWMDEAIAGWGDFDYFKLDEPPELDGSDQYLAGLAGHSPFRRVTDTRAYTLGRDFLAYLDHVFVHRSGIPGGMRGFLRHYYEKMRTRQVRSEDFEKMVLCYHRQMAPAGWKSGIEDHIKEQFENYINTKPNQTGNAPRSRGLVRRERCHAHDASGPELEKAFLD